MLKDLLDENASSEEEKTNKVEDMIKQTKKV
jgi:hypothetical protein